MWALRAMVTEECDEHSLGMWTRGREEVTGGVQPALARPSMEQGTLLGEEPACAEGTPEA